MCVLSHVQLFATPWTVAGQAPLSVELSWQEYWNGLPFPSPGDLSNTGIELQFPASPELAGGFFTEPPEKPTVHYYIVIKKHIIAEHLITVFIFFIV